MMTHRRFGVMALGSDLAAVPEPRNNAGASPPELSSAHIGSGIWHATTTIAAAAAAVEQRQLLFKTSAGGNICPRACPGQGQMINGWGMMEKAFIFSGRWRPCAGNLRFKSRPAGANGELPVGSDL